MVRFKLLFIAILLTVNICFAQERKPVFVGLQPSITKEKFYDENEFDINVIPIVVEIPIAKRMDLRINTIANYHFGRTEKQFSDIGFQALAPIFLRKKEIVNAPSGGFYIAPVGGYGRNLINDHHTYLIAVEPGYLFPTQKSFTLSIGVQLGGSYFDYDVEPAKWEQHFGVKINLGFWI
jgi:hypothetical protein